MISFLWIAFHEHILFGMYSVYCRGYVFRSEFNAASFTLKYADPQKEHV